MIAKEFQFYRPAELSEALSLLEQDLGDVRVLAGGMTLVPAMNLGIVRPDAVISLNHVRFLDAIVIDGENLTLGALVRHRRVETDLRIRAASPLLNEASGLIADVQVRHRGTIGGSLAHADPAANYIPPLVALGARLGLASRADKRWVKAGDFFKGALETDLKPGEVITEIVLPLQAATQTSAFYRLARVHGSFAIANGAAVVGDDAARVVVGGATEKPIVVEESFGGSTGGAAKLVDRMSDAVHAACREPIDDLYGSADYRRSMARVAAKRALSEAFRRRGNSKH